MSKKEEKEFNVDIEKLTAGLEHKRNVEKPSKFKFKFKFRYIIVLVVIFVVFGFTNNINSKQDELRNDPWAKECSSIDNFEYTLENKYIRIDEYIGTDKRVKLCKNYMIDGIQYELNILGDEVFASKNIFSVLFPNSIEYLPAKTFYKSKVKYIYLPKSLGLNQEERQFSYYIDNVEKVYYEGTKNEWEYLIDFDKEIDDKIDEVILECKYDDLKINE